MSIANVLKDYTIALSTTTNLARAEKDHFTEDEGLLPFRRGDPIIVKEKGENGWWVGQIGSRVGHFPAELVTLILDPVEAATATIQAQQATPITGSAPAAPSTPGGRPLPPPPPAAAGGRALPPTPGNRPASSSLSAGSSAPPSLTVGSGGELSMTDYVGTVRLRRERKNTIMGKKNIDMKHRMHFERV